ncbi:hypothetical protein SXCC_00219 [Gluconacetobacter sp. SXCC-1]|nr:hypothetical protein SXCC_00219 [Gluconacetobacter sp. SXCC-1]
MLFCKYLKKTQKTEERGTNVYYVYMYIITCKERHVTIDM